MQETPMPHTPVRAAPRPLFDLLSDALIALLDPVVPGAARGARPAPARLDRFALFDVPTYQRRRLRIDGLDAPDASRPDRGLADGCPPAGPQGRSPR
jgi:hypothetical protein